MNESLGLREAHVFCSLQGFLHLRIFTSDPEVLNIGAKMLVFAAAYQLADAVYANYNGALRGAGDTLVPAVVTAILNWSMTVAVGYWAYSASFQFCPLSVLAVAAVV